MNLLFSLFGIGAAIYAFYYKGVNETKNDVIALWKSCSCTSCAIISIIAVVILLKIFIKFKRYRERSSYPKDTVILHQYPRGFRTPNPSPFSLKLETWLRMAKIKYQNDHSLKPGAKGKIPWITYNGKDYSDSQFIIEFLSKERNVNLDSGLSPTESAVARAFFKLAEESLFWCLELAMFVHERDPSAVGMPSLILNTLKGKILKIAQAQGYGRHSREEVYKIGKSDLKAINDYIGSSKKFLTGNSVCNTDSALFGVLAQLYYHTNGDLNQYIKSDCPNIVRYIENIRKEFWPDWDQVIRGKPFTIMDFLPGTIANALA